MGPQRAKNMSPARSAIDKGLVVTTHLDTPVVPMNPLFAVWCAVNRISYEGSVVGKHEAISVMEALRAITINAAWQIFKEDKLGSIEKGKFADLVILSDNPLDIPSKIKDIVVEETIVGGISVFKRTEK